MKIKLVYKSKSGFTERYAEWIAQETGCELIPIHAANTSAVKGCDVLIYGSRMHAGRLDGLPRARKLFEKSGAKRFVVFATGGMPCSAADTVEEMWRNNLTGEELATLPHFYMQAGICYEKLGPVDKVMMKMAASMMEKQAEKNPMEAHIVKAVQGSYDISDKQYIAPLVGFLHGL